MRLFIAINFKDETKNSLSTVIDRLGSHVVKGNFTSEENLHLTLIFIGETSRIDRVKHAMDKITAEPFKVVLLTSHRTVRVSVES